MQEKDTMVGGNRVSDFDDSSSYSITFVGVLFAINEAILLWYNHCMDFTQLYKKYKGLWVALSSDEKKVLGKGKSVQEAVIEAKERGEIDPILFKVPTELVSYIS